MQVTFTDDRLNAQIELLRVHRDLDRGRPVPTLEGEQTAAQKRDAGASASGSTPEKNIADNAATRHDSKAPYPHLDRETLRGEYDRLRERLEQVIVGMMSPRTPETQRKELRREKDRIDERMDAIATRLDVQVATAAAERQNEVLIEHGEAPFDFGKDNKLSYYVRTVDDAGQERLYWGKDLPRALDEAGARIGDVITATRVGSKPVTVEEIQEQPDGSKQVVRVDAKRNAWQVQNHGMNREAVIKAYDTLVKSPEDRKKLEITTPLLVAARDKAVVEIKREKLAAELNQRNLQNHTVRSMKL
jgi:hypothetical protein